MAATAVTLKRPKVARLLSISPHTINKLPTWVHCIVHLQLPLSLRCGPTSARHYGRHKLPTYEATQHPTDIGQALIAQVHYVLTRKASLAGQTTSMNITTNITTDTTAAPRVKSSTTIIRQPECHQLCHRRPVPSPHPTWKTTPHANYRPINLFASLESRPTPPPRTSPTSKLPSHFARLNRPPCHPSAHSHRSDPHNLTHSIEPGITPISVHQVQRKLWARVLPEKSCTHVPEQLAGNGGAVYFFRGRCLRREGMLMSACGYKLSLSRKYLAMARLVCNGEASCFIGDVRIIWRSMEFLQRC